MNILITTLSLGENYTKDYTLRMIEDVLKLSDIDIYITTDCEHIIVDKFGKNNRIKINPIKKPDVIVRLPIGENKISNDFNFNMRYKCLEHVQNINDSVIIFTDCDNSFDWWSKEDVVTFIKEKYEEGFDFFGPRNDYKWKNYIDEYNLNNIKEYGIFWHKIFNYELNIKPKPEWDESPLPAEYLLIFNNNNNKMKEFVKQWKWFHDFLCDKKFTYGTWAEGFEIGVSSLVSGFKAYDIGWDHTLWGKIFTANGYKTGPRGGIIHQTER